MEHRFKMRISRMLRASFTSCRTRNASDDVVRKPLFVPQTTHHTDFFHFMDPLPVSSSSSSSSSHMPRTFSSICRPNCPENTTNAISNSIFPRQKLSGGTCPPASPAFPLMVNPFYKEKKNKKKKKKKHIKNNKKTHMKNNINNNSRRDMSLFSCSSQDSAYFEGSYWSSSEEESGTLFSSRTLSSDSSGSHHHHHPRRRRSRQNKYTSSRRKRAVNQVGVLPLHGKVKDSFAVVKSSSDPYTDFRTSMVEMIVERQIFSANDLEQLLQCFLSLNSNHHRRIILEVFTEIWEALFSYSP